MKSPICKVYQACIQFDIDGASTNKAEKFINIICDKALSFSGIDGLDIVSNSGGPCWGPYIEAESKSEAAMVEFVTTIETLIESYRGGKVLQHVSLTHEGDSHSGDANDKVNYPVIPEGWALVPKEPTLSMMNAWLSEVANFRGHADGYRAMLAAAPQPGESS
ncbi:hypothetical protein PEC106568_07530 [Pectobacterium carotovorum subsp. carotovorum]|nr:hypothetical protein PEC106568_07530 [Pectobacterium carotovorum subsp. carotovorum]